MGTEGGKGNSRITKGTEELSIGVSIEDASALLLITKYFMDDHAFRMQNIESDADLSKEDRAMLKELELSLMESAAEYHEELRQVMVELEETPKSKIIKPPSWNSRS